MNLSGRWAADGLLELAGDAAAFRELARALAGEEGPLPVLALSPVAEAGGLVRVQMRVRGARPVRITRVGDILHIKGGDQPMRVAAARVRLLADRADDPSAPREAVLRPSETATYLDGRSAALTLRLVASASSVT